MKTILVCSLIGAYILLLFPVRQLIAYLNKKDILFKSLIGTYILLYAVGTLVAYSNKDIILFAFFIGGVCLVAGINLGMWGARRDQRLYSVR